MTPGRAQSLTLYSLAAIVGLGLIALLELAAYRAADAQPAALPQAASASAATAAIAGAAGLLAALPDASSKLANDGLEAMTANAQLKLVKGAVEPARPFALGQVSLPGQSAAELCLAQAMYYEAGYEGSQGRRAVAQVVLNRVRHPAFPHQVCGVVYQRSAAVCQFTFACDGSLARQPSPALWRQVQDEARAALAGQVSSAVGMATHYHADYVYPAWAPRLDKIAVIGRHIFYRWPGGWGRPAAFTARYAGVEQILPDLPLNGGALIPGGTDPALAPGVVEPSRSEIDGGYLDPTKGWKPRFAEDQPSDAALQTAP